MITRTRIIVNGLMVWPNGAPIPRIGEIIKLTQRKKFVLFKVAKIEYIPILETDGAFTVHINIETKRVKS